MQNYSNESSQSETGSQMRVALGLVLIIAGLALCFQVVSKVFRMTGGGENIKIVRKLMGGGEEMRTMKTPNGDAILPESIFIVMDYFVYLSCLWLVGGIAKILLSCGASLMQPDYKKVLQKFIAAKNPPDNRPQI